MKFDHLKYYIQHNISPVGQDITNKKNHFQRREALYNQLGLTKKYLSGLEILEVGPAEGHNAAYIASCKPKRLDLVEPNPNANTNIFKVFNKLNVSTNKTYIHKKKFEDFNLKKKFDLVICEAWLGKNKEERKLITKLSKFVKDNGILIITSSSPVSFLSNIIRRFVAFNVLPKNISFEQKTNFLVKFFKNDLNTLKNMSCPHKDWVQDSLLGDGFLNMHPDPIQIFKDVGLKFNFYNSYPKFYNEWRWYKDLIENKFNLKKEFLKNYKNNIHNFIDYKKTFPPTSIKKNNLLSNQTDFLMKLLISNELKPTPKKYDAFLSTLIKINKNLKKSNIVNQGFLEVINYLKKKDFNSVKHSKYFKYNFGRELFYLSLIKNLKN